jgi:hypothetical protein
MTRADLIIESARRCYAAKCVNCAYCEFDLTDEEIYDEKIDIAHTGGCRRYPPWNGVPEVRILEDYCGEIFFREDAEIEAHEDMNKKLFLHQWRYNHE